MTADTRSTRSLQQRDRSAFIYPGSEIHYCVQLSSEQSAGVNAVAPYLWKPVEVNRKLQIVTELTNRRDLHHYKLGCCQFWKTLSNTA